MIPESWEVVPVGDLSLLRMDEQGKASSSVAVRRSSTTWMSSASLRFELVKSWARST